MLKDSEEIVKRRKLSLMQATTENTTATTTPPTTPPTPPLNMMSTASMESSRQLEGSNEETTGLHAANMAATLLAAQSAASTLCSANNNTNAANVTANLQDHYSLRWNNHQNHILRAFDALLQNKALVDVTLVCAETSIQAHKMVLSACSPFFQRVFADTPCKHPVIVLKDFRGWVVQAIVDFMYRGEISVPQERLQTLIQAGESLQVRGLVESSVPEHTPTPAASPDDFGMIDSSIMSASELERCSSFDEESPSMVTSGSKVILPSRLFGSSRRGRERKRERELDREMESDQENAANSELCTSPMPRRKQARPRRRSGELPHELNSLQNDNNKTTDNIPQDNNAEISNTPAKTISIKTEFNEPLEEQEADNAEQDSGNGNDSHENNESHNEKTFPNSSLRANSSLAQHDYEDDDEIEHDQEPEDLEELINSANVLRRRRRNSHAGLSTEGPEDLCTTKKDADALQHHSDNEGSPSNNNNNNSKLNNNNRIVLSLKDIRQLNKPSSSSTPNSANPFTAANLRDLRLDRASAENQCKMEAIEAHMHAAAAAAAAAAASGENPFQHIEHQMDLSLAAAAAAAAVSQQQSRERDHALQREQQRELQQQHNAYANSLLGQMGLPPGMPGFGGSAGAAPGSAERSAHERLEESMNRLSKEFTPSSPMSLPSHFNPPDGPPHPPSPLPFPGMSSALTLTPPHSE